MSADGQNPARPVTREDFKVVAAKETKEVAAVEAMSFEAALTELEAIVTKLERGQVELDAAIALYERGQMLKFHCEHKLKEAESRLEKVVLGASGPTGSEPADQE